VMALHNFGFPNDSYRIRYTKRTKDIFKNAHLISHQNVQRLCQDYIIFDKFAMHIFMIPRKWTRTPTLPPPKKPI
jgi:hypothetical protein